MPPTNVRGSRALISASTISWIRARMPSTTRGVKAAPNERAQPGVLGLALAHSFQHIARMVPCYDPTPDPSGAFLADPDPLPDESPSLAPQQGSTSEGWLVGAAVAEQWHHWLD